MAGNIGGSFFTVGSEQSLQLGEMLTRRFHDHEVVEWTESSRRLAARELEIEEVLRFCAWNTGETAQFEHRCFERELWTQADLDLFGRRRVPRLEVDDTGAAVIEKIDAISASGEFERLAADEESPTAGTSLSARIVP